MISREDVKTAIRGVLLLLAVMLLGANARFFARITEPHQRNAMDAWGTRWQIRGAHGCL